MFRTSGWSRFDVKREPREDSLCLEGFWGTSSKRARLGFWSAEGTGFFAIGKNPCCFDVRFEGQQSDLPSEASITWQAPVGWWQQRREGFCLESCDAVESPLCSLDWQDRAQSIVWVTMKPRAMWQVGGLESRIELWCDSLLRKVSLKVATSNLFCLGWRASCTKCWTFWSRGMLTHSEEACAARNMKIASARPEFRRFQLRTGLCSQYFCPA